MFRAPSPTRGSNSLIVTPRAKSSISSLHHSPASSPSTKSSSSGLSFRSPPTRSATKISASPCSTSSASSKSSHLSSSNLPTRPTSSSSSSTHKHVLSWTPPTPAPSQPNSPTSTRLPTHSESSGPVLEVFGDSFCGVFTLLGEENVKVNRFTGASARGLNNARSTLQVGDTILRRINDIRPRFTLFQFGAVDLIINYLWQLKARGLQALSPSEFVRSVVDAYCSFLENEIVSIANSTGMKVYIAAVLPPVVEDRYLELSITKYLQKSTASSNQRLPPLSTSPFPHDLRTRSSLVKLFNHLVAQFCSGHPECLSFVNINKSLVSQSETTRVSSDFIDSQDPTNIHLLWERTIQIWCREIPLLRRFLPLLETRLAQLELGLGDWEKEKREKINREKRKKESSLLFLGGGGGAKGGKR
ncbi:hypothetical protein JCM3765_002902 [Sporobolomyces pararoseus]